MFVQMWRATLSPAWHGARNFVRSPKYPCYEVVALDNFPIYLRDQKVRKNINFFLVTNLYF